MIGKKEQEKIVDLLIEAATTVFISPRSKVLEGNVTLHDSVDLPDKKIGQKDIPKTIVIGICGDLKISDSILDDKSILNLGDNPSQVKKNIERYRSYYAMIAKHLDGTEYPGIKRFVRLHNMVIRKVQNMKDNVLIPELPYKFK